MKAGVLATAAMAMWLGSAHAFEICSAGSGCSDAPGSVAVFDAGQVAVDGSPVSVAGELLSITGGAGTTIRIESPLTVSGSLSLGADTIVIVASVTAGPATAGPATVGSSPTVAGVLPIADVIASIAEAGKVMGVAGGVGALAVNGAHHRPLLARTLEPGERCVWVSGDAAAFEHADDDARAALAEFGGCVDLLPSRLRAGLAAGKSYVREDLAAGGRTRLDGEYLLGEVDYRLPDTSVIVSVLGLYGRWDADIDRAVSAAGRSFGDTDVTIASVRFRVDWRDALSFHGVGISPRVALTVQRTEVDGYTETGGALALRFDDRRDTAEELRYGLEAEKAFTPRAAGRLMVEGVHAFDARGAAITGDAPGLFSFRVADTRRRTNWARAGAEFEYVFDTGASAAASVNASTAGRDPSVSGGLSLQFVF